MSEPVGVRRPTWRIVTASGGPVTAALLIAISTVGVVTAVGANRSVERRYRADAHLTLRRTTAGPDIQAVLARRLERIERRFPRKRSVDLLVIARPGDPSVFVAAHAPTAESAVQAANLYATELLAADVGVDRAKTAAAIKRARAQLAGASGAQRARLRKVVARLTASQVTDANIQAAAAVQTDGPRPFRAALVALLVSAVIAASAVRHSRRMR